MIGWLKAKIAPKVAIKKLIFERLYIEKYKMKIIL
jgi:hypothetical protein